VGWLQCNWLKKTFKIARPMHNAEDDHFLFLETVEHKMFRKSRDRHSAHAYQFWCLEITWRTGSGSSRDAEQYRRYRLLSSARELQSRLFFIPSRLLKNVIDRRVG